MKARDQRNTLDSAAEFDSYWQVLSSIQNGQASTISVPELSKLLGVKATTLNARFRRQQTTLKIVGRTSFISLELALSVAALHKYALLGWPTLRQASLLTGVKSGTIKARCEKGRLEGHRDLTKRLRINPAELKNLQSHTAEETATRTQARPVRGEPADRGDHRAAVCHGVTAEKIGREKAQKTQRRSNGHNQ